MTARPWSVASNTGRQVAGDPRRSGGTLTSIRAVRRRVGPGNRSNLLERDDCRRIYWIGSSLLEGLKRAFDLADARPDLLRREPA
ncbi:hypothetical protein ACFW93_32280 [Streptomyces canus]|uniref:hypothetical protein n=1 Tax=Streptomyces canus TaxID=58343 RepID=UPI0036B9CA2F